MMHVTLVSPSEPQLAALIRACGATVSVNADDAAVSFDGPPPDVIVFDLRERRSVPALVPLLRRRHPELGIVIIALALDTALLLEAVRAGVNEVVAEPLTQPLLQQALTRVLGQRAGDIGQVFGFIGAKGGVGTTTVAVNTAMALGALSTPGRTLLLDLHQAGGDAALFLRAEPRFTVADALTNAHRLDATLFGSLVTEVGPNTDFLGSPDADAGVRDLEGLRGLIEFVRNTYRYTVIDLPRADPVTQEALDILAAVYIVANQELPAVWSGSCLAFSLRGRYGADKIKIVLSRPDQQAEIQRSDVARVTSCDVAHSFPSDYRRALNALNKGRPVALEDHNELSSSFRSFARRLAGTAPEKAAAPRLGLFGRLVERGTR